MRSENEGAAPATHSRDGSQSIARSSSDSIQGTAAGAIYLTDQHLRAVAEVYSRALLAGFAPVMAVAGTFGLRQTTAAKRVQAARRRGFLPQTTAGVPKGGDR